MYYNELVVSRKFYNFLEIFQLASSQNFNRKLKCSVVLYSFHQSYRIFKKTQQK